MLLIYYPNCSTCRRALAWLRDHGFAPELREIHKEPPTEQELKEWVRLSNKPIKSLFNTSGQLYRQKGLKDQLPYWTEEEKLSCLATDGLLVKRPLLILPQCVLVGFKEEEYKALLSLNEQDL